MNKKIIVNLVSGEVTFNTENINYSELVIDNYRDRGSFKARVIDLKNNKFILKKDANYSDISKVIDLLSQYKNNMNVELIVNQDVLSWLNNKKIYLPERYKIGESIKLNNFSETNLQNAFLDYKNKINNLLTNRKLSEYQLLDSFYLYIMKRASNFSVPGSGKTTTCLATYKYLLTENKINNIIIIGPKSSYKSWKDEYFACFNKEGKFFTLDFHSNYTDEERKRDIQWYLESKTYDLYFINYESVFKKSEEIKLVASANSLIIFDEAHKIKSLTGKWATACKDISKSADYRVILTGTPIPNGYEDIFNTLQILYGEEYDDFFKWSYEKLKNNKFDLEDFKSKIFPFFIRTTKEDLKIPAPNPDNIIEFELSNHELDLYETISFEYKNNFFALCIRLLQSLSHPEYLLEKLDVNELNDEFDEIEDDFIEKHDSDNGLIITDKIKSLIINISVPSKIKKAIELVKKLRSENKKIILWSIFLKPMYLIESLLKEEMTCEIINGSVKQQDREKIIDKFQKGYIDLLISNPQTMAESVSLHQSCHDAIYIDFSYNLVHMLQSRDRIHRFGIPNDVETNYYYFIANNLTKNIDRMIYRRLKEKEEIMLDAINSKDIKFINIKEDDIYESIAKEILGIA